MTTLTGATLATILTLAVQAAIVIATTAIAWRQKGRL